MSRYAQITPVAKIETKRLLAIYNAAHRKNTTKFASRTKGEEQVQDLIDNRGLFDGNPDHFIACPNCYAMDFADDGSCEHCGWKHVAEVKPAKAPKAPKAPRTKQPKVHKGGWEVDAVREARLTRDHVQVSIEDVMAPQTFRSVKAAFIALKLPLGIHIRFRMQLKEAGAKVLDHDGVSYSFAIIKGE